LEEGYGEPKFEKEEVMLTLLQLKTQKATMRGMINKQLQNPGWANPRLLFKYKALVKRIKRAEDQLLAGSNH